MTQTSMRNHTPHAGVSIMNTAFQNAFGDMHAINWSKVKKQCLNIFDEIKECESALAAQHSINFRDGLCDVQVFAYGGVHFMGYCEQTFNEFVVTNYEQKFSEEFYALPKTEKLQRMGEALQELKNETDRLHKAIDQEAPGEVLHRLGLVIGFAQHVQLVLRIDVEADMAAVLDGLMTRFIKDEVDEGNTYNKHNKAFHKHYTDKGETAPGQLQVYYEGEYPNRIMKSAVDQPDAPKGKFLKSASFKEAEFLGSYFSFLDF